MKSYHTNEYMHVSAVALRVKDEGLMLDYYINVLKMKIIRQEENKFYLGTKDGHVLVILEINQRAKIVRGTVGLYHYALLLPTRKDLAKFLRHYLRSRKPFVGASDHLVSEAVYLEDPEGNGIEVYVDRADTKWKDSNGNIAMNTLPLNMDNLFSLLDDEVYTEIPSGTIMGHLHLHVGNMKEADHFFNKVVGFDLVLKYGPSAEFLSDKGYHHHLAFNVWQNGSLPRDIIKAGLKRYTLSVPLSYKDGLLERLRNNQVTHKEEGDKVYFTDVNEVEVETLFVS